MCKNSLERQLVVARQRHDRTFRAFLKILEQGRRKGGAGAGTPCFLEKCLKIYPEIHFLRYLSYIVHPLFLAPCAGPVEYPNFIKMVLNEQQWLLHPHFISTFLHLFLLHSNSMGFLRIVTTTALCPLHNVADHYISIFYQKGLN